MSVYKIIKTNDGDVIILFPVFFGISSKLLKYNLQVRGIPVL